MNLLWSDQDETRAGQYVAQANPERGRFRSFMLTSIEHFLANEWNRSRAQKRGGGVEFVSVEFANEVRRAVPVTINEGLLGKLEVESRDAGMNLSRPSLILTHY